MSPRSQSLQVAGDPPVRIVISEYSNLIFAVVTQVERMGTIVSAYVENPEDGPENYVYATEVKFGARDNEDTEALARGILECTSKRTLKPLLLSLALTSPLAAVFPAVTQAFESLST